MLMSDSRYPFVCVDNRDEYWDRVTMDITVDDEGILSANDEKVKDATWMGLNVRTGAFVALTNVRHKNKPASYDKNALRSRGHIVRDLLKGKANDEIWNG